MNNALICPVILSGGSGSRLWPMSRAGYPKQFLPLATENTMLQDTVSRVSDTQLFQAPLMICNAEHRFIVADQLRSLGTHAQKIILEPVGRNTAPAVAVAALSILKKQEDALMLVLPSDHVILNQTAFMNAVNTARQAAQDGKLVTFGIDPDKPETGYGYIQKGNALNRVSGAFDLTRFVEKPDEKTAEVYVASGEYYWNSGIFLLSARQYLDELGRHHPEMVAACEQALDAAEEDLHFSCLNQEAFVTCPSDSIDYAVMEKTQAAAVVPVNMSWNDLGAWSALWDVEDKDEAGNASRGDVLLHNTRNSYVHSEHALVAVTGLDNVIVVATDDAVLVANREQAQDVKKIVDQLKADGRYEHNLHTTVHRPWGHYRGIDLGDRYQVKRITVKPGERLSLQMHHHRAEHWIVVKGTAKVTNGEKSFLLRENESTYIPMGEVHRLENPGKVDLELIEVQSGGYLGEDDIVRFEDGYGRAPETNG
jgi:mannose-1-phosphate guanylyltransferase/mannose-6-phosphate isomerase